MTDALVVKEGSQAGERLELNGELVIGREGDVLGIDDEEVSRRHAVVRPVSNGFELEDLGSQNGTFVNGSRINGPTRILSGDEIKIGQTVLELEVASVPEPEPEPEPEPTRAPAAPAATRLMASPVPPPAESPPQELPPAALAPSAAPSAPFGAYAVPETRHRRGIASRQFGPLIVAWAVVIATAVALVIYFSNHPA